MNVRVLCAVLVGWVPAPAWAISCTVTAMTPLSFGSYDVFSVTALDSAGGPTLNCTGVAPGDLVTVELSKGASATFSPRTLVSGLEVLQYDVYLDAARMVVWGDGTGGTAVVGPFNPADGVDTPITGYGRIPAQQDVAPGVYSDTLVVTVVF